MRTCTMTPCERKHYAKGLCFPHYLMHRRRGTTERLRRPKGTAGCVPPQYTVIWHNNKTVALHRHVWTQAHGPIPPGHHIHHVNGDPRDNRLENLACLPGSEHLAHHWQQWRKERSA